MNGFKKELEGLRETIDLELEAFLNTAFSKNFGEEFSEEIKNYVLRKGKRVRPVLAIKGFECFKKFEHGIVGASVALELLHASLLIDDDVMDCSDLRRGMPSLHKLFENSSDKKTGESMAIIAAMVLRELVDKAVLQSSFSDGLKLRALKKTNKTLLETGEGQRIDVSLNNKRLSEVSENEVMRVMLLKTAKYSFENPLVFGAILASAEERELKILSEFAKPVGIAFQIRDDVIGLFGEEERIGKPVTTDLAEGKKTLLVVKAYEQGSDEQKKVLLELVGKKSVSHEELEIVRRIVKETGALDYCTDLSKKLVRESVSKIDYSWPGSVKNFLRQLCFMVVERDA